MGQHKQGRDCPLTVSPIEDGISFEKSFSQTFSSFLHPPILFQNKLFAQITILLYEQACEKANS